VIRYVTTNSGKLREARERLDAIEGADYDYEEIQSDSLAAIAARGAREAYRELDGDDPVIVDDAGLFVEPLDGFPGPYSAYVEETLGIERVARLALAEGGHGAAFRTVVAYADGDAVESFEGVVEGEIVAPRGEGGFGYDPIFEHDGQTFAERSTADKNAVSHRGRALDALADWLDGRA
jgi:XTP/dITP diphosphohydrolase